MYPKSVAQMDAEKEHNELIHTLFGKNLNSGLHYKVKVNNPERFDELRAEALTTPELIFGSRSNAGLAQELAKTDKKAYRALKEKAREKGLI